MSTTPDEIKGKAISCDLCDVDHVATFACKECEQNLCAVAAKFHRKNKSSASHKVTKLPGYTPNLGADDDQDLCLVHHLPFEYYDAECGRPVCLQCYEDGHHEHRCQSLEYASSNSRRALETLGGRLTTQLVKLDSARNSVEATICALDVLKSKEENNIKSCFEQLHNALDHRELELQKSLEEVCSIKYSLLSAQRDKTESYHTLLKHAVGKSREALSGTSPAQLILARNEVAIAMRSLKSQQFAYKSVCDAVVKCHMHQDHALNFIQSFGTINAQITTSEYTYMIGRGLKTVCYGRTNEFTIKARDHQNRPCSNGGDPFTVSIKNCIVNKLNIEDNSDGTYTVKFEVSPLEEQKDEKKSTQDSKKNKKTDATDEELKTALLETDDVKSERVKIMVYFNQLPIRNSPQLVATLDCEWIESLHQLHGKIALAKADPTADFNEWKKWNIPPGYRAANYAEVQVLISNDPQSSSTYAYTLHTVLTKSYTTHYLYLYADSMITNRAFNIQLPLTSAVCNVAGGIGRAGLVLWRLDDEKESDLRDIFDPEECNQVIKNDQTAKSTISLSDTMDITETLDLLDSSSRI